MMTKEEVTLCLVFDRQRLGLRITSIGMIFHIIDLNNERSICREKLNSLLLYAAKNNNDIEDSVARVRTKQLCSHCHRKFEQAVWDANSMMAKKGKTLNG